MSRLRHLSRSLTSLLSSSSATENAQYSILPTTPTLGSTPPNITSKAAFRPTRTSWIDGLRGLLMLIVFNYHYFFAWSRAPDEGFVPGHHKSSGHNLLQYVRLIVAGVPMVYLFFLLAGYVMALGPMQLMARNGVEESSKLLGNLCSSSFRRALRLLLPVYAMTTLYFLLQRTNLFAWSNSQYVKAGGYQYEPHLGEVPAWSVHTGLYWKHIAFVSNAFAFGRNQWDVMDPHHWYIPLQLRASFAGYLVLMMVARGKAWTRFVVPFLLSVYAMSYSRYEVALTMWGIVLAYFYPAGAAGDKAGSTLSPTVATSVDIENANHVSEKPTQSPGAPTTLRRICSNRILSTVFWLLELGFALWCLSSPRMYWNISLGYKWLGQWIPTWFETKEAWTPSLGAPLLLHCLLRCDFQSSWLLTQLNSHSMQFIGKVSFGMYLVHGPYLFAFGFPILGNIWSLLGGQEGWRWLVGLLLAYAINLPASVALAWAFNVVVESRCQRVTAWLERAMFQPKQS